jgi:hypothetical protein
MSQLFTSPFVRATVQTGVIAPGAEYHFCLSGTSQLTNIYTDETLSTTLPNPIAANAFGLFPSIYLAPDIAYRVRLFTSAGVLVDEVDPLYGQDPSIAENAAQIESIRGVITSGRREYATYASAASDAVTPTLYPAITLGQVAEVPLTDAGTHTDPVVGGTVPNSGIFRWSVSPAGFERIADVDAVSANAAAASAAADAATAGTAASAATAAAADAIVAATVGVAAIGYPGNPSPTTYGTITSDSANAGSPWWSNGIILDRAGQIESVTLKLSSSSVQDVALVQVSTRVILALATSVAFLDGVPTENPFGILSAPAGSTIMVRRISGGSLRQETATGLTFNSTNATYVVGDTMAVFSSATTVKLGLAYTVSAVDAPVEPRVASLEGDRLTDAVVAGVESSPAQSITIGQTGFTPSGNANNALLPGTKTPAAGIVTSVSIQLQGAGTGMLEFWRTFNGGARKWAEWPVVLADGVNPITIDRQFAPADSYFYYRKITGNNAAYLSGGSYYNIPASPYAVGDTATVTFSSGFTIGISVTMEIATKASFRASYETIKGPLTIARETFAAAPANWTIGANFTPGAGGLAATGTGGWDKFAVFNNYSSLHKRRLEASHLVNDAASIFGICTNPRSSNTGTGGAVSIIDGVANKIRLYAWNGSATAGTLAAEVALPAALTAGRIYTHVVVINGLTITATITDTVTLASATVSGTFGAGAVSARFHGQPGFMHIAGDVAHKWANFAINAPRNLRAVGILDSNGEGTATGVTNPSWIFQLASAYDGILVAARSGESSADMAGRLNDLTDLRPRTAFMAMGTNDSVLATWRSNVGGFIDACRQINAEPILCIPPPKTTNGTTQAFITSLSADITGGYFGAGIRYVDFLGALSNAHDRLTWNATYGGADNLHANNAGQSAMLAQVLATIPEIAA